MVTRAMRKVGAAVLEWNCRSSAPASTLARRSGRRPERKTVASAPSCPPDYTRVIIRTVWGLLWDVGNKALAGKCGVSREEVDAMHALGEWRIFPHRTRAGQHMMVGPVAPGGRLIAVAGEWRTLGGQRRFRPILATAARAWARETWARRHRQLLEELG